MRKMNSIFSVLFIAFIVLINLPDIKSSKIQFESEDADQEVFVYEQEQVPIYTKPVYRVKQEDQNRMLRAMKIQCIHKMLNASKDNNSSYCPITWDNVMCWDKTPAGQLARKNCPSYVDRFVVGGEATKLCSSTGLWFTLKNNSWTNFSQCSPKINKRVMGQTRIIKHIGMAGYLISLISLILASFILLYFRRLRCDRNTIHINLYMAFVLRSILYFPSDFIGTSPMWACKLFTFLTNYSMHLVYTWVFIEALYLHNIIFYALSGHRNPVGLYIGLGWGMPVVVLLIWAGLRLQYDNTKCWVERFDPLKRDHLFLVIYGTLLTVLNMAFFINLVRALFVKVSTQPVPDHNKYKIIMGFEVIETRAWKLAKAIFVLVIVFGLYQVALIPIDFMQMSTTSQTSPDAELVKLYCENFFSSFQGFLVSLLFCFTNGEVHEEIKQKLGFRSRRRMDEYMLTTNHER